MPADDRTRRAAVIVNPTKFTSTANVRRQVTKACLDHGWDEPLWLETTPEDTGHGQTVQALAAGVDLVCPLGGDGTVRQVAEVMVGSGVPVGLLPGGTGNLLARTLGLPIDDLGAALRVALTGTVRRVDVGRVGFDVSGEDERPLERVFLVMAGLGFDAAMMEGAPERLKAKVGWLAYALSGLRNLRGPDVRVRVTVDENPSFRRRVRTVLVGNSGTLTGGIVLMPEAEVDDGWLNAVAMSPKGVLGWAVVAARVLTKGGHARVEHFRCRQIEVHTDRPQQAQLDGDTVGLVRAMRVRVDPGALQVQMPAS
ncbi:MAG TPA: diacylglycerol kinase family protein [Actinomycetales bacterium]|nr:diacylglycerol kinase family protein [Actinomycetales bacterium]